MPTPSDLSEEKTIALRPPSQVMRLARLGAFHQTRLSFLRSLMRRLRREQWSIARRDWQVDDNGVGHALYTASGPDRTYTLVAFAHDLDPALRSDRVIAEQWDATFTLFDGEPGADDIERLRAQVPLQEAGRVSDKELTLSRANRSVRLFDYVRDCLASGRQPDAQRLDEVGYLMRTTAVYGSAKFGVVDRQFVAGRQEFAEPFQAELLTVYLIRTFTVDIVEHMAAAAAPQTAVALAPKLRRRLGVGNSTGLGMAPFLVNHPALLHHWIHARETALATVRCLPTVSDEQFAELRAVCERQQAALVHWHTEHAVQHERIVRLRADLSTFHQQLADPNTSSAAYPLDQLFCWAQDNLELEAQELVVSLLIEPFGDLVDDLTGDMSVDEQAAFSIDGRQSIGELQLTLNARYDFARAVDFSDDAQNARFWYVSEEKLEPRLGERFDEPGAEREDPLATARDIRALMDLVAQFKPQQRVAELLLRFPECRHTVRRVQIADKYPYSEIHDNLIADNMVPLDMLRCKLSFFGASRFDPRSDRWVRITLFQFAPFPSELHHDAFGDAWVYPPATDVATGGQ